MAFLNSASPHRREIPFSTTNDTMPSSGTLARHSSLITMKPTAYLRTDCPFSFKFLLFISEARIIDQLEIVRCDPNASDFEQMKQKLAEATGKQATFPTVQIEPNVYKSDSDALVAHYAKLNNIDSKTLPAFSFYMKGIFAQLKDLHDH